MSEFLPFSPERLENPPTSRAEALAHAIRDTDPATTSLALRCMKSLYAGLMPRASSSKPIPATPASIRIAEIAGVEIDTLAAANTIALNQAIDPALGAQITRVGEVLARAVEAVLSASSTVRSEVIAAQERLVGRTTSSEERANFRTRITSRLGDEAADALRNDPVLVLDALGLERSILAAARAGIATPSNPRWAGDWTVERRRANGQLRPITVVESEARARWEAHAAAARPRLLAVALRYAKHDLARAEDLVQEALVKMLQCAGADDLDTFVRYGLTQLKQVNADGYVKADRAISVDWEHREEGEDSLTPEDRAFGHLARTWASDSERQDGRLDGMAALRRLSTVADATPEGVVRREIGRIAEALRAGSMDAELLTDRPALIAHLVQVARTENALSAASAKRMVIATLEKIAGEER
ncbi:hypothetical protein [Microbacterium sp. 1P10AE]|uniref:hypothetical protein n=1 Tax=Microbacterium sp. 1P10AE TaxID=3132286 RepID=UPI0039A3EB08